MAPLRRSPYAIQKEQDEADRKLRAQLAFVDRQKLALECRDDLLKFTKFTMPDPEAVNDISRTKYEAARFHRSVAKELERVERGEITQLIFCMPPRHGKTELATKRLAAWFSGRHPAQDIIIAAAGDDLAHDFGADIRAIMQTPNYKQIFPEHKLRRGGTAKDNIVTDKGGRLICAGRGGQINGRGAHLLLIDDLYKDFAEARSQTIRDQAWDWFTKVALYRRMGKRLTIITMCMTGDTRVLMADATEKFLRDVRPGDLVASYDSGRLVSSRVLNHINNGPDSCYEIRMTSGITVKANERHPFLVDRGGELKWVRLRNLRPLDDIVRVRGINGKTSFAGMKSAISPPNAKVIARSTTTKPGGPKVSDRLQEIRNLIEMFVSSGDTGLRAISTTLWLKAKAGFALFASSLRERMFGRIGAENFALTTATTQAKYAGFCATTAISPLVTEKLKQFCSQPLDMYEITRDKICSINEVPAEDVYDVQIERTENFIANGLVSHNTRWHSDDIIGRLTDPENPHYNADEAADWKIIRLPGIAEEDDPLGREPGEALWPEPRADGTAYDVEYHLKNQRRDPLGFAALTQQRPTVADGTLFRRETIQFYEPERLPEQLRVYAASDHAVGTNQRNDPSCFVKIGVSPQNDIYILDVVWKRMPTDEAVAAMLALADGKQKPLLWWAERGHISKSIGPFLRKRMLETQNFINIVEVTPAVDKEQRAQSIAARVAMGKVYFPKNAWWTQRAVDEMLAFPNGNHDDFVDAMAYIGLGLQSQFGPERVSKADTDPKYGTLAWVKQQDKWFESERRRKTAGGW